MIDFVYYYLSFLYVCNKSLLAMKIKERYEAVVEWFKREMPEAETELHYSNPFELLVAVILSAQCTDKRVNMFTPALFRAYPTPEDMSKATVEEIFNYIRSISFPNNKAKHLSGMSKMLVSDFAGEVPSDGASLERLPGVGRKTANVIRSVIFDQPAMAVDTHVFRVSNRIGLTRNSKTPIETEKVLMRYIAPELVPLAHHWLILHGRYVCVARKPKCDKCGLSEWCRYYQKVAQKREKTV